MLAPGDQIPSVSIKLLDSEGTSEADSRDVLGKGRVVFFTVPGAFTPTCSTNHLPGYLDHAEAIRAKGISRIVCGAVNDHHVVKAWADATGARGKIDFIADGNAELCKALGLERDMSAGGMGIRYIRAAIIINNGRIEAIYAEKVPGEVSSSGAPAVLASL
jgi:peroxiredoxin